MSVLLPSSHLFISLLLILIICASPLLLHPHRMLTPSLSLPSPPLPLSPPPPPPLLRSLNLDRMLTLSESLSSLKESASCKDGERGEEEEEEERGGES